MNEGEAITSFKCGLCHKLKPLIFDQRAKTPEPEALFKWLEVFGLSLMCQKCTDNKCGL
jgi:hypothetical protein